MSIASQPGYLWNRDSIIANAPAASGCYVLFNDTWVYVGESDNIQQSLLKHLEEAGTKIARAKPSRFSCQQMAPNLRVVRRNVWIAQLHPSCNELPA
jgi:hypothetical protein